MEQYEREKLAEGLHNAFDGVVRLPLPWRLIDLLCELEERDAEKSAANTKAVRDD